MQSPLVAGWSCTVCGASVDIAVPLSWRCPRAGDDRHHVLQLVQGAAVLQSAGDANPFLGFRQYLAWDGFAAAAGLTDAARAAVVSELEAHVAAVEGRGFVTTPFARADALSDALGFAPGGGVWVKDETHNVGGSHKARHLFTILLHLRTAEIAGLAPWSAGGGSSASDRPPLAIASCGNAAIAAGTLAAAVGWPIRVFVPSSADLHVTKRLAELGATVVECPRLPTDPPGDPCVHRFREAVAAGAVPFSVQGTENAWCLDGGRTIGWEMVTQAQQQSVALDRVFVQVGGGAFAACVTAGLAMGGSLPRLHAVQTQACAPLARAWERSQALGGPQQAGGHWADCMWPWEHVGESAADGILDDETYDWLPVLAAMATTGGSPVVVAEADVLASNEVGCRATGIDASATGTAGLAGLLAIRGEVGAHERVAVVFSGVRR
ncbi:MAG: PLP-dependent lyase/thiolase [Actinomycetota bacterium]|nr:PLP-dependent lyase/thiolase [Actinomycetota bacterium]